MFIKYNGSSVAGNFLWGGVRAIWTRTGGKYANEPSEEIKIRAELAKRGGDGHGVSLLNSHYLHTSTAYDALLTFLSSVSGKWTIEN